jgi:6-phosphogluconolactonase
MSTIVYVACAGPREIHCFDLDAEDGALKLLDVVAVPGGAEPSPSNLPLAFAPDQSMLYAALRTPPFPVTGFAVDSRTGRLTCRGTAPLPAPMAYIAAGHRGLLAASYKQGLVSVSAIGPDGAPGPVLQVLDTPPKAHCILPGRHGAIVYATTVDGNAIMTFRQDAKTGQFAPADPHLTACRPGSGPRHLALHPQLDVLYCVNELAGTLAAFAIEPQTGALRELQYEALTPDEFAGNARAADLHVTADGRFAYASVRETSAIAAFRIDQSSGALALIARFDVEGSPRAFALDPHGRHLICAGQTDNVVGVYAIAPDSGVLTRRHLVAVPENPSWIETLALPVTS